MAKTMKVFWNIAAIGAIVAGTAHIIPGILTLFGQYSGWAQVIAGVLTISYVLKHYLK